MGLVSLRLTDFRNVESARVELDGSDVFLVGDNGQGKTNFLEAVYLCCCGSSFRTRTDRDLIRNGRNQAAVWARFAASAGERTVGVAVERGAGKTVAVDGKRLRDRAQLIASAPTIAFTHEDLRFIDGEPERRRWFFDQTLTLFDPLFIDILRRYRRALRARNTLLRAGQLEHVDVYDHALASNGLHMQQRRAATCAEFNAVFADLCQRVGSLHDTSVCYRPSWSVDADEEQIRRRLRDQLPTDSRMRTTTSGPHRDDFLLMLGDARFSAQGSTGQKRLASLVLRVAQADYFHRSTGNLPILLLDDVLLELDASKRQRFLEHLPAREQAFFTFLPDEPYARYEQGTTLVLTVREGRFAQCNERVSC